jgi:DNA invertase Pin-like site-specific DNA recombinase
LRAILTTIRLVFFPNGANVRLNMNERENGQTPLPSRTVRSRISADVWEQIRTAYASGIGLREIARNMNIPEGTVLAHAKREGWTREIQNAKALAKREDS